MGYYVHDHQCNSQPRGPVSYQLQPPSAERKLIFPPVQKASTYPCRHRTFVFRKRKKRRKTCSVLYSDTVAVNRGNTALPNSAQNTQRPPLPQQAHRAAPSPAEANTHKYCSTISAAESAHRGQAVIPSFFSSSAKEPSTTHAPTSSGISTRKIVDHRQTLLPCKEHRRRPKGAPPPANIPSR